MSYKSKILQIEDADYRAIDAFSYSVLKSMDDTGPAALLESKKLSSTALEFGTLVDVLITDSDKKDDIFWTRAIEKPTASLLQLADAILLDANINSWTVQDITRELIEEKIKQLGLWTNIKDSEKLREKYHTDVFLNFIDQSIQAKGKIILTPETLQAAEHCANVLKTHPFTAKYFTEEENVERYYQAVILYPFKGILGKGKLDLLIVDHNNKTIQVIDIKTGAEIPSKFINSFYFFKYYLQVISYMLAAQYLIESDVTLKEYKILSFKFLYVSKKLPDVPVIFEVQETLLNAFADGWISETGRISGFLELVDNYKYAVENQIFNVERKVMEKNGLLKIELI